MSRVLPLPRLVIGLRHRPHPDRERTPPQTPLGPREESAADPTRTVRGLRHRPHSDREKSLPRTVRGLRHRPHSDREKSPRTPISLLRPLCDSKHSLSDSEKFAGGPFPESKRSTSKADLARIRAEPARSPLVLRAEYDRRTIGVRLDSARRPSGVRAESKQSPSRGRLDSWLVRLLVSKTPGQ